MKIPLAVLALCSLVAGFIPFGRFITSDGKPLVTHLNLAFSITPVLFSIGGILLASYLYRRASHQPQRIAIAAGGLYRAAYKKFYIDELYLFITKKILFNLVGRPAAWFDKHIVDGFMNLLATSTAKGSALIKGFQSGKVQSYTLYFFGGVIGLALLFIYLW
jgi:NADH-quinone oxidoreductase subunit L